MKTEYVPRVNQLDALQLDDDIARIVREQLTKALQNLSPGLLSRYQPELNLLLRSAVWKFSVYRQCATFGQQLLLICYDTAQMSNSKMALHYFVNVMLQYFKECATLRMASQRHVQTAISYAENVLICGALMNFFRFLRVGKKASLADWFLGLDYISMYGNKRRDVGYSHMTRELIWGGFMELLGFTLPLVNYHSVKRKIRTLMKLRHNQSTGRMDDRTPKHSLSVNSRCAYCLDSLTLPYHMGCAHVFCYYCLEANVMADSEFQCPVCDWKGTSVSPVFG